MHHFMLTGLTLGWLSTLAAVSTAASFAALFDRSRPAPQAPRR